MNAGLDKGYRLYFDKATNTLKFQIADGAQSTVSWDAGSLTSSKWYHLAASADGSNLKLYLNGEAALAEQAYSGSIGLNSDNLIIGNGLQGNMDDWRIYNRALEQSEIAELNTSMHVPPKAPSNLYAEVISSELVKLSWEDNSDDETRFHLERKTEDGDFTVVASLREDNTEYSNRRLQPETKYSYRMRALNDAGYSPYSNEVTVKTSLWVQSSRIFLKIGQKSTGEAMAGKGRQLNLI